MDPLLGEIRMFGGNFAPRGWALCNGQLLSIAQNTALFSILGITYGGNGQTTFALPNLQGRIPMHWGSTPGLSPHTLGEAAGTETVTLLTTQMPMHNHLLGASNATGGTDDPTGNVMGKPLDSTGNPAYEYVTGSAPNVQMNVQSIQPAGGSQPHANMQPYLCVTFIIALEGVFPSRN